MERCIPKHYGFLSFQNSAEMISAAEEVQNSVQKVIDLVQIQIFDLHRQSDADEFRIDIFVFEFSKR